MRCASQHRQVDAIIISAASYFPSRTGILFEIAPDGPGLWAAYYPLETRERLALRLPDRNAPSSRRG